MNASVQFEIPGLLVRRENATVLVESAPESRYCGLELLYALAWFKALDAPPGQPCTPMLEVQEASKPKRR